MMCRAGAKVVEGEGQASLLVELLVLQEGLCENPLRDPSWVVEASGLVPVGGGRALPDPCGSRTLSVLTYHPSLVVVAVGVPAVQGEPGGIVVGPLPACSSA